MMKKLIPLMLILIISFALYAQGSKDDKNIDDFLFEDPEQEQSDAIKGSDEAIVQVFYDKKDARKAMLYSMLLPGAGQYYANKSSIGTYLFPVIEVALLGGLFYYNHKGNQKTKDYEKYATGEMVTVNIAGYDYVGPRYSRAFQQSVQAILIGYIDHTGIGDPSGYVYNSEFFNGLHATNTQHFYEDIGKYDKYIFGWADWYHTFATNSDGVFVLNDEAYKYGAWNIAGTEGGQANTIRWLGNCPIDEYDPDSTQNNYINPSSPAASPMRREYIRMRQDAEGDYSTARLLGMGMAINHLVSGFDAIRVTNKRNRYFLSDSGIKLHYYADLRYQSFTPSLALSYSF